MSDSPWLISSWPPSNSQLFISADKSASGCMVSPFVTYTSDGGTIPVILYFNQAVSGVNASSVAIRSALAESKDVLWRPISGDKYGRAQAWVGLLKVSDLPPDNSINHSVEVSVEDCSQIISQGESCLSQKFLLKFMVCFQHPDSGHVERRNVEVISWEDSNFQKFEMSPGESDLISSFNPLQTGRNCKDQEVNASEWKMETLANEIEIFRDLLSVEDWYVPSANFKLLLCLLV